MAEPQSAPKNKETRKRLLSSSVLVIIAFWVIFYAPPLIYCAVVLFYISMGLNEYTTLLQKKSFPVNRATMIFLGLAAPLAVHTGCDPVFIIAALVLLFSANARKEAIQQSFAGAAVGLFGIVWIAWLFSYVVPLRYDVLGGAKWVFYAISVVKLGDAGAYFIGNKFGRTPFIPHISPKKTWEGAWAQLATTVIASCLSRLYLPAAFHELLILGIMLGVMSQVGDCLESIVKRNLETKDSGILPGLGGFLDVLDSLLFTIPLVYIYLSLP